LIEDYIDDIPHDDGLPHTQWITASLKQIYQDAAALCTYRICCGSKTTPVPELRVGCGQISVYCTGPVYRVEAGSITPIKYSKVKNLPLLSVMIMDRFDKPQVLVA
jgi:hypothetical protein